MFTGSCYDQTPQTAEIREGIVLPRVEVFILHSAVREGDGAYPITNVHIGVHDACKFVVSVIQVAGGVLVCRNDFSDDEAGSGFNKAQQFARELSSEVIRVVDKNDGEIEVPK